MLVQIPLHTDPLAHLIQQYRPSNIRNPISARAEFPVYGRAHETTISYVAQSYFGRREEALPTIVLPNEPCLGAEASHRKGGQLS